MRDPDRTSSPSRLRLLVFAGLTTVMVLAGLEGAARLVEPPDAAMRADARTPVAFALLPDPLFEVDDDVVSLVPEAADALITFRSPKPEGELRVVVLGGSATAGYGLPAGASFVGVAERAVARALPERRVRFLNLARSGWASSQVALQYSALVGHLDPDVVLVVAGNNELLDVANAIRATGNHTGRVLAERLARAHLALARLIDRWTAPDRPSLNPPDEGTDGPPPMPKRWEVPEAGAVDAYVRARLVRNLRRIRDAAPDVPMVLGTVAVNQQYRHAGTALWFFGPDLMERPRARRAALALHVGAPEEGIEALGDLGGLGDRARAGVLLAMLQELAGRPGEAARTIEKQRGPRVLEVGRSSPDEWVLQALALRLSAQGLAQLEDALEEGSVEVAGQDCLEQDVRFYGGLPADYSVCSRATHYYRADASLNQRIRASASRLGATLVDLEALVGRGGPPGYDHFWDYCHYTPAASVLVGQALAAGVLDALGEPPPPVTPSQAHAAFFARWRGRTVDPLRLEHWTGVDFNGVGIFLWADGAEPNSEGDPAAAAVYRGNRHASAASPTSLEPAQLARAAWADARVLDPTLGVVLDANERLLRWRVGEGPIDPRALPALPPR